MNNYETLQFCDGAQNKKDINGWTTLDIFDNSSQNNQFNARVYKRGNRIVLAFSGSDLGQINDISDDLKIMYSNNIPSQYYNAEKLYTDVKHYFPTAEIEFVGYSLGGTLANLLSHKTGLKSTAIAPIGSKHVAEAHPNMFRYDDSNITTYGRKSDYLFNKMINKQSGRVLIIPDLDYRKNGTKMDKLEGIARIESNAQFKPHLLHNISAEAFNNAKPYTNKTSGYASDINDLERIFTAEEIGEMSNDDFIHFEPLINSQINNGYGIPRTLQAQESVKSGNLIWVDSYTRTDGTHVSGYFRHK